jgi:conjugal transfer pilus assembly protein TraB
MPLFLQELVRWLRRHPLPALLGTGLLGLVVYWQARPAAPPAPRSAAAARTVAGAIPPTATLEAAMATVQRENEQLRLTLAEQQKLLARLEQAQQQRDEARQRERAEQERRLEAALQQALASASALPAVAPAPVVLPPPATPPPRLRILRPATPPAPPPDPVVAPPPEPAWAHLPAGSFVRGRLVTGMFATTRAGGALPALFAIEAAFSGPNQTAIPLQGCLAIGKAQADLGALRAIVQLDTLACVLPGGQTFERPVAGYVTGQDGTLGIPGRLEHRAGAYLAQTFLASLLAGAAEAFARAEATTVVTPLGGSLNTVTGDVGKFAAFSALATASARMADFYLDQAAQLLPVVWVEAGKRVHLVVQQGITIEGLPATAAVPRPAGLD